MKRKTQRKKPEKRKQSPSASDAQNIRVLAECLSALIPQEGYRSSFSLKNIVKKHKLGRYYPNKSPNKKEAFYDFLYKLYCYKPRTIKKLIREILPIAVEKRHREGNPILTEEAENLSNCLFSIGINMKSEIKNMRFPKERPSIVPPPITYQKMITEFNLYPALLPDCEKMFIEGHLNESVRKSLEIFEKRVQEISGIINKFGADLMAEVFSETKPKIKLNDATSTQEKNEQVGYKFIAMGIMQGWRNNLSHGNEQQIPHQDAIGRLILVSNMLHRLDHRILGGSAAPAPLG
ncbi:MAG: TIGR02391 family protein [Candidatus Gottesmanbacteria bacterium]|nr:TIGR02391 family protein [Candidatus Gottesmanbacteria bacterium]